MTWSIERAIVAGFRFLRLVGDVESPGVSKLYGTDGTGTRGWYDQPAGGPGSGLTHPQVLARTCGS